LVEMLSLFTLIRVRFVRGGITAWAVRVEWTICPVSFSSLLACLVVWYSWTRLLRHPDQV
jgi:hypothetical protein